MRRCHGVWAREVPDQHTAGGPWDEGDPIGALAIRAQETERLHFGWDVSAPESACDDVVREAVA